eukprot:3388531-Rhodomonas_salina.1
MGNGVKVAKDMRNQIGKNLSLTSSGTTQRKGSLFAFDFAVGSLSGDRRWYRVGSYGRHWYENIFADGVPVPSVL